MTADQQETSPEMKITSTTENNDDGPLKLGENGLTMSEINAKPADFDENAEFMKMDDLVNHLMTDNAAIFDELLKYILAGYQNFDELLNIFNFFFFLDNTIGIL